MDENTPIPRQAKTRRTRIRNTVRNETQQSNTDDKPSILRIFKRSLSASSRYSINENCKLCGSSKTPAMRLHATSAQQPAPWSVAVKLKSVLHHYPIFRLRQRSLARGTILSLASFAVSFRISHFPDVQPCLWLIIPFLVVCASIWDTARCLQKRWNFYHGAVLLMLYCDLMILLMVVFFLLAPYSDKLL
jgi:hypothetical protein